MSLVNGKKMAEKTRVCVIGVDDSEESAYVFDFYVRHFHKPENHVVLVYVVQPTVISSNQVESTIESLREKHKTDEQQRITTMQEKFEGKMKDNNINGRISIIYYSKKPGKMILTVAKEENCAMVIVGQKRNISKFSKTGEHDEIVEYIMRKASFAVVVVRQPDLFPASLIKLRLQGRDRKNSLPTSYLATNTNTEGCASAPRVLTLASECQKPRSHSVVEQLEEHSYL